MIRQFLSNSPLVGFAIAALSLFFVAFAGILARVFVTRAKDWEAVARLPFEAEDERHG